MSSKSAAPTSLLPIPDKGQDQFRLRIGVFDSGLGANYVANRIKQRLPQATIIVRTGRDHMPYGRKTPKQIWRLIEPIIADFGSDRLDGLIIACNTVATNLMPLIQTRVAATVVGFEPPLAQAAAVSRSGRVLVCATAATLKSRLYQDLRRQFEPQLTIIDRSYRHWAVAIETGRFRADWLRELIDEAVSVDVDCIVLGCTHYHWLAPACQRLAGTGIVVVEPTENVINDLLGRLKRPAQTVGRGRSNS